MIFAAIFVIAAILLYSVISVLDYKKSDYFRITHNTYYKTHTDLGIFGEYMCYRSLRDYEKVGARFLFNLYIPRIDSTTEIDMIMIHPTGLYVLESRNYSGWIFGSDSSKYWTQTLPQGKKCVKEKFLNPVIQNRTHIKYLKK